ncbi:MAG: hypothetical protein IKL78_04765 [Lachnospiraceae bacterium]|nr:hypothetical protein [Lachnospiraceae bacterium]
MSKVKWLACFIVHGLMAFKIWVDYWKMRFPMFMIVGIVFVFLLDIITYLRQNSESYGKEIGEYDYEHDNFPIHVILFPLILCCMQNSVQGFVTGSSLVAFVMRIWLRLNDLIVLVAPFFAIYECIRILSKSKRKRATIGIDNTAGGRLFLACIAALAFYDFMTM